VKKISIVSEKISFILLCILMVDCSIMGFAAWADFGPLGSRMMILLLSILFAIPTLLSNMNKIIKDKYFISVMAFAGILGIAAIIGIWNNHRISLLIQDIKGYACFAILPVTLCLLNNEKRIRIVMKSLMFGSTAAALYNIGALILYLIDKDSFYIMAGEYREILFAYYGPVSQTIARLFYQSSVYLLCGCAFALYFYITSKKKTRWMYSLIIGICLFSMLLTYTRSLYLGAFVTAALIIIFVWKFGEKEERKDFVKCIGISAIVFVLIASVFGVVAKTDYVRFAILRSASGMETGELDEDSTEDDSIDSGEEEYLQATIESDELRSATLKGLFRNIKKSPVIGIGLGAEFKERPEGVNEYVYLDLMSKAGIVGLIAYLMPFFLIIKQIISNRKRLMVKSALPVFCFSVLIGFMIVSFFNPYMSGALGIPFYCCTIASVSWMTSKTNI